MTLSECVLSWINDRSINLAISTVSGYNRLHRLYIFGTPAGGKELAALDRADLVALLKPLLDRGCTRQAQLLQVVLSSSLKSAVRRREIVFNPMEDIPHIKHHCRVTAWLTVDQARRLLVSSAEADDPYYLAWLLMLCCGLRRGEMLALEWSDIDFSRGLLHVHQQHIDVDGIHRTTRPKSASSIRDIPLSDHVLTILRLHQQPSGCILKNATRTKLSDALNRALIRAEVPRVTLHGLRHTMASVAASDGISVKILQSLLGHAHYQTTADIYAHVNQSPQIAAVKLISHSLLGARLEIV